MKYFLTSFAVIAAIALGFIITDCSAGDSHNFSTVVSGHRHILAWTETKVEHYTDKDTGVTRTRVRTIHHPEEWHVYFDDRESERQFDINVGYDYYHLLTNGADVTIRSRVGKWTKAAYLPQIASVP